MRCEKLTRTLAAILSIDASLRAWWRSLASLARGRAAHFASSYGGDRWRTLRNPNLRALSEEVASRGGTLEVELRAGGTTLPVDRARILASPSVLREALALIERAQNDDALLSELAPAVLASDEGADEKRLPYLKSLLAELPEELMQRSLVAEET